MDTAWYYWTEGIARHLSVQLGVEISASDVVVPPSREKGDFAFGCFRLAKERSLPPAALAKTIALGFDVAQLDLAEVIADGPYVNFRLRISDLVERVIRDVEKHKKDYGCWPLRPDRAILLEYANPNTHKEIHVGHLRGFFLGQTMIRIARAAGQRITPISFVNDLGNNVAKSLWFLVASLKQDIKTFSTSAQAEALLARIPPADHTGSYLGEVYTQATRAVDADETLKTDISYVQQQLEAHQPAWERVWLETRRWCLDELWTIFAELGVEVERQYLESQVVDRSIAVVDELLQKQIAQHSQGALIVDLEKDDLGAALIRKSDGTHLYLTKDLALAELKLQDYPGIGQSYVMADVRQTLHFRQLAAVLKRMGMAVPYEFIGYELVTLKAGAMSSRKGNIVTYQKLRDAMLEYARGEIIARHPDWFEGKVTHAAWSIALAAMKFGMLKQDPDKVFVFDLEEALSFDGNTGPYCQYAVTRLSSILKKALLPSPLNEGDTGGAENGFEHQTEKVLALAMAELPLRIEQAARDMRPSVMAQWCFEMAQAVHRFYRDVPVIDAPEELRAGRIRLVTAAQHVLTEGLGLLGINLPEEM